MQRLTITVDDELVGEIDRLVAARGYQNRSEAIRDLALVYVYDHAARELSKRLTRTFHDHHTLSLASLHVHLDHDSCMEVNVLRGPTKDVQHFADHVVAERGVRHGQVVMVAAPSHTHPHEHAHPLEAPKKRRREPPAGA
jgi:CopG family nickel-responsive transcriptional regulator